MTGVGTVVVREFQQRIDAPPAVVFPLLCPVRECDWLDRWQERCRLVRSGSGFAEEGCVFVTSHPGRPDTTWVITRHDAAAGLVDFCRVCPGVEAVTLAIQVHAAGTGSAVSIRYTAVPLPGSDADAFAATWDPDAFSRDLKWWEASMNHYLATGSLLRHP